MSKLAAICAKLKVDAVTVNDVTTPAGSSLEDTHEDDIADSSSADISQLEPDDVSRLSPEPLSLEKFFPAPTSSEGADVGELASFDSSIGLLKRKSIMPVAGGASRRKKQRPISSHNYDEPADKQVNKADDTQSIDGSEHSLHIDLADEKGDTGKTSPFQQYALPASSASSTNPGVLQALGLTGVPPNAFPGTLASQSLAAFAEQVSSFKTEPGTSRPVSPAYASEDSLNDSNFKSSDKSGGSGKKKKPLDPSKYLSRYTSAQECGSSHCIGMNYREHYHCLDCTSRIIVKKEEMVRHYKWHQKREDSLQHGFMRYSPFDDCTIKFGPCAHNKKQTHYHCIQAGCNKVYVSTSDVQMHANYHRKASAIILEGFQRFRATEDCGTPSCDFYSQRTTHFHCRRPACNYTFKNKADMEKHKTYHQKDEILSKDGFKKYMKYEHCPYQGCAYSKLSNHIHCMRPGCQYVLHSTSQLYPHKRKHEKQDADLYASYSKAENLSKGEPSIYSSPPTLSMAPTNDSQSMTTSSTSSATMASDLLSTVARLSQGLMPAVKEERRAPISFKGDKSVPVNPFEPAPLAPSPLQQQRMREAGTDADEEGNSDSISNHSAEQVFDKSLNLTPGRVLEPAAMNWKTERSNRLTDQAKSMMGHFKIATSGGVEVESVPAMVNNKGANGGEKHTELWKKYLTRYTANDPCNPRCWLLYKDHYHCNVERCFNAFKNKDGVRDHARLHDNQERISKQLFNEFTADISCETEGCQYSGVVTHYHCKWMNCPKVISLDDDIFARFDHFQEHELASRINQATQRRNSTNPPGAMKPFPKKRGRPPKTATFPGMLSGEDIGLPESLQMNEYNMNYSKFDEGMPCYDELCKFRRETHYHCNVQRCHIATNRLDVMRAHSVNFHSYIQIPENYAYFDRNVNCRGVHCSNNRNSCHYHCLRPGCEHSFIRHTTVAQHDKKHREENRPTTIPQPPPLTNYGALAASQMASVEPTSEEVYSHNGMPMLNEVGRSSEGVSRPAPLDEELDSRHDASTSGSKTVKASGTFFPQAGKPEERAAIDLQDESSNGSSSGEEPPSEATSSLSAPSLPSSTTGLPQGSQATAMFNLLAQMSMFLQQRSAQSQHNSQQSQLHTQLQNQTTANTVSSEEKDTWQKMLGRMYASPQLPCASVFCKKKQQEHYHCLECNSAFNKAHEAKLKAHIFKHSKYSNQATRNSLLRASSSVPEVSPPAASQANTAGGVAGLSNMLMEAMSKSSAANGNSSAATSTSVSVPDSSTDELPASSSSIQDMMMTALQLQVVSNGRSDGNSADVTSDSQSANQSDREDTEVESEVDNKKRTTPNSARFKSVSSIDCGYANCTYSKVCEHFHCPRDGCSYSVTDQSKLPQHMRRHEKLDQVLGDDFKLHKPQSNCQRADCEFAGKVSHFHCQICPYICTDANRILPHRRNHLTSNTQSNSIFNSSTDIQV